MNQRKTALLQEIVRVRAICSVAMIQPVRTQAPKAEGWEIVPWAGSTLQVVKKFGCWGHARYEEMVSGAGARDVK